MNRSALWIPVSASLLLLSACGGSEDLTVIGSILVSDGDALSTGFPFAQETRLDEVESGSGDRITGSCEMRRTVDESGLEQWGVVATIRGATQAGRGLSSITLMQSTEADADGRIEAELGTTLYTSQGRSCSLAIEYAVAGLVRMAGECEVADVDGNQALAAVDVDFAGCEVVED